MFDRNTHPARASAARALAAAIALGLSFPAAATDFSSGDWKIDWTNTFQYTLGDRVKGQNPSLLTPNFDDGDRNFDKGIEESRIDVLSELDVVYQNRFGARVSAAGWYDPVYSGRNDNPGPGGGALPNQTSTGYDQFTRTTQRLQGRDLELRDAFVFYKFDANGMLGTLRVGQHAVVWGESLFFAGNAIAGAQNSFDIGRLDADPTAQAKDFVLPVPQVSFQLQITNNVSVQAYYQFDWRENRFPAVGSYFSPSDIFGPGAENMWIVPAPIPGLLPNGYEVPRYADNDPKNGGQFGLKLGFSVWDIDFGLYALRFHDKTPQIVTVLGLLPSNVATVLGSPVGPVGFYEAYQQSVSLYGFSASHSFGNANVALEASIRNHQDLASSGGVVNASPLAGALTYDDSGNPPWAVGHTAHVNLSTIYTIDPNPLFREGTFVGEIAWNRMLSCQLNCLTALDPNGKRNAESLRFVFTPMYRQILPGLDLGVPIGAGFSPNGKPLAIGPGILPPDGGGDVEIGLDGTYQGVWNAHLAYTHYFGQATPLLSSAATPLYLWGQTLQDRDFIAFTLKRSF